MTEKTGHPDPLAEFIGSGKFEDVVQAIADEFENEIDYEPGKSMGKKAQAAMLHNRQVIKRALLRGYEEGKTVKGHECDQQGGHFFEKGGFHPDCRNRSGHFVPSGCKP